MNKEKILQLLEQAEDLLDNLGIDAFDKAEVVEVLDEIKDEL